MPAWSLAAFSLVAFVVTGLLAYTTITSDRTFRRLAERDLALIDELGTIVHLDEVLTMSARMAATTGQERWVGRYMEAEPRLASAINRALTLAPDARETRFLSATNLANSRLVAIERRSLEMVRRGEAEQAAEALFGQEYETLKDEYRRGALASRRLCEERIAANLRVHRRAMGVTGGLSIAAALVGFVLLFLTARWAARRHALRNEMLVAMRRSTLGELAASLAHELNQPLSAIVNYCGAVRRVAESKGPPEAILEAVGRAEQQAERAGQIIGRIRSFVRGQGSGSQRCCVAEAVRDAVRLVQTEARGSGVALRTGALPDEEAAIDPVQLEQVLVNLLLNAIDACAGRERASVQVVGRVEAASRTIVVEVRDTGPGVPRAFERHLFEPFRSTKPAGLGLGLSISREIVENHAGQLAHTREGEWTCFAVRLPEAAA